jgi:DNA invertase Pin-like site-specific DNA recombinase
MRMHYPEPLTHSEAAAIVRRKTGGPCRTEWLQEWERVVPAWRHPKGPVAFPYLRVSDRRKAASGLSFEVQIERCIRLHHELWAEGEVALGPAFSDPMVSGWKKGKRLRDRRGGRDMHEALVPGDHIIFYQPDRSARLVADSATLLTDVWEPNNITPHFCLFPNLPLDNATGAVVYNMMAALAEWYSASLSERMLSVAERLRSQNRPTNGSAPRGWKIGVVDGQKQLVPDMNRRKQMAFIEHLRDIRGMNWEQIAKRIPGKHSYTARQDYDAWKAILETGLQKRPERFQAIRDERGMD